LDTLVPIVLSGSAATTPSFSAGFACIMSHDEKEDTHFLVGGTEGKLRVANPEQVRQVLDENKDKKATKVNHTLIATQMYNLRNTGRQMAAGIGELNAAITAYQAGNWEIRILHQSENSNKMCS
jgi:hypothetical protein